MYRRPCWPAFKLQMWLTLAILAAFWPDSALSQYHPKYVNPTRRLLDQRYSFPSGIKNLHLCTLASMYGLNLKFNFEVGQTVQLSSESTTLSGWEILDLINAIDGFKTEVREWEVLVVSDINVDQIRILDAKARNLADPDHVNAIEQLLSLSHPAAYPSLFWVMKHGRAETALKVCRELLGKHGVLMNYAPDFRNAAEGFERTLKIENPASLYLAYNLPSPILNQIDFTEWLVQNHNPYLEQQVTEAKLTFADMTREYANAPPSPQTSPLCGTGYVHIYNHNDYANMIGDLRTDEAYAFLNDRAEVLASKKTLDNHRKLAELAIVLSKRDTNDALKIATVIIDQQQLDNPSNTLWPSRWDAVDQCHRQHAPGICQDRPAKIYANFSRVLQFGRCRSSKTSIFDSFRSQHA